MFLAMALDMMGVEIDIDEAGLTMEHFEKIDELLGQYLDPSEIDDMIEELIQIVKELTEDESE
jgi:hypothetical protein